MGDADHARASFWSYELSKQYMTREHESDSYAAAKVLLCGGLAGIVTWLSIFPLGGCSARAGRGARPC